jgi:hypothetical protein
VPITAHSPAQMPLPLLFRHMNHVFLLFKCFYTAACAHNPLIFRDLDYLRADDTLVLFLDVAGWFFPAVSGARHFVWVSNK